MILTVPNNLINNLQSYLLFLCFNISSHFSPTCRQSLLQVIFIIPKNFFLLSIRSNYSTLEALDPIVPFPPTTRQCPTEEEWGNVVCCGSSTSVCREPLTSNLSLSASPPLLLLFSIQPSSHREEGAPAYISLIKSKAADHTHPILSREWPPLSVRCAIPSRMRPARIYLSLSLPIELSEIDRYQRFIHLLFLFIDISSSLSLFSLLVFRVMFNQKECTRLGRIWSLLRVSMQI